MTSKNKKGSDNSVPGKDNTQTPTNDAKTTETKADESKTNINEKNESQAEVKTVAEDLKKTEPTQPKFEEKQGKRGVKLGAIAIVISILFGGGLTYHIQEKSNQYEQQLNALRSELQQAQSTLKSDIANSNEATLNKANEIVHRADTVLEQQQKSIESLQLAITDIKGRRPNDWLLAEADYLVKLAGRKLFLEHDVVSATALMESADQRIAALNDPSLVPLRKAMANDITALKVVPLIDRDGLVLRITALQQQVDNLPLANALLPELQEQPEPEVSENINDWQENLTTSLKDFSENFITFRTRDGDVIPLLSPQQHFYLKENIKAKLETAIKAVYLEQQDIYTAALTTADEWSTSFFNQDNTSVKEFNKTLEMLSKVEISVDYPVKLETQNILSDVITDRLRREVTSLVTEEK